MARIRAARAWNPGAVAITGGSATGLTSLSLTTGAIVSGTYTPTLTNSTNIDASTARTCQYMRIGDVVVVSGNLDIDTTAASVSTVLRLTLPIASNLTAINQCAGVGQSPAIFGYCAEISGDTTLDVAVLQFTNGTNTGNNRWSFIFQYQIA